MCKACSLICILGYVKTNIRLVGSGGGVSGVHQVGVIPLPWREFNFQLQISDVTKLCSVKARTERRIFCYLCNSKIIAKGDVVGM